MIWIEKITTVAQKAGQGDYDQFSYSLIAPTPPASYQYYSEDWFPESQVILHETFGAITQRFR